MQILVRIYYEDTDCGGVVYYANYLRYFERGRTELLRERGVSLEELLVEGVSFVVTRAEVGYRAPCRYGDLLRLDTRITGITGATVSFEHSVRRQGCGEAAVEGTVLLVSVGRDGKPVRMPKKLRSGLAVGG